MAETIKALWLTDENQVKIAPKTLSSQIVNEDGTLFADEINQAIEQITTIPDALPNPNALTFTGAVTGTYDGSEPLNIEIPSGGDDSVTPVWTTLATGTVANGTAANTQIDTGISADSLTNYKQIAIYIHGSSTNGSDWGLMPNGGNTAAWARLKFSLERGALILDRISSKKNYWRPYARNSQNVSPVTSQTWYNGYLYQNGCISHPELVISFSEGSYSGKNLALINGAAVTADTNWTIVGLVY